MNGLVVGLGLLLLVGVVAASWLPSGWSVSTPEGVLDGWNCSFTAGVPGGVVTYASAQAPGGFGTATWHFANGTISQEVLPSN